MDNYGAGNANDAGANKKITWFDRDKMVVIWSTTFG